MNLRTLAEIWIYPIKSLGGIRLEHAFVQEKGLRYDRRMMLVDESGMFLTQRFHPQMALCKVALEQQHFTITHHNKFITLPLTPPLVPGNLEVKIWDDTVTALEVGGPYSSWFSQALGISCKLVYFPETNPRPVDPDYKIHDEQVSLADAYPFLIIGQSSLDDLNSRLTIPLPMNRFRPNFVFTGGTPYEEDQWKYFSIGKVNFAGVKNCKRCVVTTIDQETGEKGSEPLLALSQYRKRDSKVIFGQNLVALEGGEISVGDAIELK
ncbi:MAG: MOSC domain-containing protein [Cyclobacteriaceae bacterium]|nr:MOSC domain-containing protein [Cyclobacteriaceae bacterium]